MTSKAYVAVDLGASSGRHVLGHFDGERLRLEEAYRFENGPVEVAGNLHWDALSQWSHIKQGLRAAKATGTEIVSVGVDTWGVDFALLGRNDELLGNPYHYRDSRTNGMMEKAFAVVPREEIFQATGLQFMQFNSLYQLLAMKERQSSILEAAERLLMMPDLFHWLLTGVKCNEMSDVSTSQCYDPTTGDWAFGMLDRFGLPRKIFGEIVQPGTVLGGMRGLVAEETGLANVKTVLPGCHDTASAVAAVPAASQPGMRPDWCYVSLGTWALMGVETPAPVVNARTSQLNFTNEGGVARTNRLLKNIAGLWLVQECRRVWQTAGKLYDWDALTKLAEAQPAFSAFVNPDAGEFLAPGDMPEAIRVFCQKTGQAAPTEDGAVIRCALESVAMKFRQVFAWCEELAGGRLDTIHIVGGGVKNRLICQMAADACGRRVVAGPIEATAVGNLMMQAIAMGDVGSLAEARRIVARSFEVEEYLPRNTAAWDEAYSRFQRITE